MDKVINCLFAAMTLLLSARGEVFKGKEDYLEMFARTEHMRSPVSCHTAERRSGEGKTLSSPNILCDSWSRYFEALTNVCGVNSSVCGSVKVMLSFMMVVFCREYKA